MINKKKKKSERFSSETTLTIASIDIEGITRNAPSRIYGLQIKKDLT
jgi:hypothetical protein